MSNTGRQNQQQQYNYTPLSFKSNQLQQLKQQNQQQLNLSGVNIEDKAKINKLQKQSTSNYKGTPLGFGLKEYPANHNNNNISIEKMILNPNQPQQNISSQ